MEGLRYEVIECFQPGWGKEEWYSVATFKELEHAIKFQKEAEHFFSRDVIDTQTRKCVSAGWRIGD